MVLVLIMLFISSIGLKKPMVVTVKRPDDFMVLRNSHCHILVVDLQQPHSYIMEYHLSLLTHVFQISEQMICFHSAHPFVS